MPMKNDTLSVTFDAEINPVTWLKVLGYIPDDSFYQAKLGLYNIQKVIFNPPATVIIWADGSKTVVKVKEGETYDKWAGLAFCISKKILGENFHAFYRAFCD